MKLNKLKLKLNNTHPLTSLAAGKKTKIVSMFKPNQKLPSSRRDGFIHRQISNIKELTPEYAKIQTFYEEPFLPEGSVTQIDWESIQFGPLDQLKSATFHELRKRGEIMSVSHF